MKLTIRLRDKIMLRYGAHLESIVNRIHKRLLKRLKNRFEAALGVDDELLEVDEAEALRQYLERTIKVTYRIGRAQGAAEGLDIETAAGRHTQDLSGLTDKQMNYSRRLFDDQEKASNEIIREVLQERGPDTQEMARRMEDQLGMFQGRAQAIAVTETADMYSKAYTDTLQSNGIDDVIWRADEGACDECQALDGTRMTIMEFRTTFPKHPNDRCWPEAYVEE